MAIACSIFTLDEWVQMFWVSFDMCMTGVPLTVALGLDKLDFWAFQKNNHGHTLEDHLPDYIFKCPKIKCVHPSATVYGTTAKIRPKAEKNIKQPPI